MPHLTLKPLADQVIVITGASSGIGLATAEAAARAGAKVVMTARGADELAKAKARLEADGGEVEIVVADITEDDAAERIAQAAVARFGRIDTWVNKPLRQASAVSSTPRSPTSAAASTSAIGERCADRRSARPAARPGGAIINLGSIESDRAVILQATYSAMKHAVKGFTEAFRTEVEADGLPVQVTLIKPAAIHTPFPEHARNVTGHPITLPPVIYDPRLVARAILFAAEHPRRSLSVGGTGVLATVLAQHFPRLADLALERFGEALQTFDAPPPADRADNHWEPRVGAIDSTQDVHVRRQSLWLEAQMNPALATGLAAAAVIAGIALGRRR